ncbi:MAG: phospho-N-acetylmuramoyl-pentapeptide-transferase [Wolinella sp.]
MLYYLHLILEINLFQYITFRAGAAFFIAFCLTLIIMPRFIQWARSKKAEQPISEFAPKNHHGKANTPTMGGIVFVTSTIIATLLCARLENGYVICGILTIILFSLIGLRDDFVKVLRRSNAGLSSRAKMAYLLSTSGIISLALYFLGLNSELYLPFYKNPVAIMGILAPIFWMLVLVSTSNAVNITDGLDGLATVPSIYALVSLSVLVYVTGHAGLSSYLLLPKISESGEVVIISSALAGSLIGFLWFNCHPAQVFMGDSGSLSIGAFVAYMAIISKNEFLLFLIGLIFVIETVSVILQIGSYKMRGKRIFLMAPIHHHFEVKGWAETKIIVRFWIIALMSNIIALLSLKVR